MQRIGLNDKRTKKRELLLVDGISSILFPMELLTRNYGHKYACDILDSSR